MPAEVPQVLQKFKEYHMNRIMLKLIYAFGVGLFIQGSARGDLVRYTDSPDSFPLVTAALQSEFGTVVFPPLAETTQGFFEVQGIGAVELTFRFLADTGTYNFQFGFYRNTPALEAVDLSTDAGRIAYARQALAPGNATLVFDDLVDDPSAVRTVTANGGDILGFFLIPDDTLARFQADPDLFAVEGVGSATYNIPSPLRWPLFGLAEANPQAQDQLLSFSGISAVTGRPTNVFAWEDLARAVIPGNPQLSDSQFNDLIFAIEGIQPIEAAVPEPSSLASAILGLMTVAGYAIRRRSRAATSAPGGGES